MCSSDLSGASGRTGHERLSEPASAEGRPAASDPDPGRRRGRCPHRGSNWHPRTRPEGPYCHPGTQWTGLTIYETVGGGEDDETGLVKFTASYRTGDGRGAVVADALSERSRFTRRAGRWLYLDAVG